ncbi:coiled-coil domain-containing protein 77 [Oryzias latipes]|uniref:coiled-coil domain-containing protein 77 n=1 Tax=Oryzias latipes TaxID=8090 RepID=UPI0002A4C643|nr:coiled-coil domain-containing protein 77 [Oryzias latipes]XP_011474842.1 coiled-coil domain-containing protein 77 [Oryzias latipes]XP_020559974.1 coiled-coil domain-containing protein 77 [Oryzias latipes]
MGSPAKRASLHRSSVGGQEDDSPLPPVHERLAHLRPSRELLEFYRQKIAQYDGENEELLQMLEKHRSIMDDQHKLQWELRQREGEVAELQNALSDMQVYLFQEREQSLRLYAENDRLKIREFEDRKKIQHLLALVGPDAGEVTYFHREPPHKVTIAQKQSDSGAEDGLNLRPTKIRPAATRKESNRRSKAANGGSAEALEKFKDDNQTLLLQVEALQAQLEEQTRLAKEQVEALLEDRKIKTEEAQAQQRRDQERIAALNDKLQQTQNLLHESTRDFLQLKFESRAHEKSWMAEKDGLLRELDSCHHRPRKGGSAGPELWRPCQPSGSPARLRPRPQREAEQPHRGELKVLQEELKQAHRLAEMYREQCIAMETQLSQIREEGDVGREIFQERSEKMAKRLQVMTQRYEALEKRRAMEVEGFKTDLKQLRQKLKDVEKQLIKVTLNVGANQDLAVLHEVRQSNSRTKKLQEELMRLKAKIYGLENELRFS